MAYIKDVQVGSDTYLIEPTLYIAPTKNGAAYTATLANFSLATGATVQAKFAATNNENATLNVNSTGAKEIHYNGDKITANQFKVNHVYTLVYDGTQWQVVGDIDTNTNTWRGIQDNLTSDSATESLSAKQGKVLKGLIDAMDATTPAASGNATAFIDSITQTDGKITSITKKNIPTASTSTAGIIKIGTTANDAAAGNHNHDTLYIKNSDELLTTNPFAPASLKGPYISKIDNAFYAADRRWSVTGTNISNISELFNGDYESQSTITANNTAIISIDFDPNHNNSAYFPGYPYGYILVSFYYTNGPANVSGRVYCNYNAHGIGWHNISFSPISDNTNGAIVYKSEHQGCYNISQLEITITANSSNNTSVTQIEMHLDRPNSARTPFLSKYNAETLYYNLTAPKFIGALQGNADTTTKFNSTRKIELTGAVTGSATTDGSSGWSLTTTIGTGKVTNAMLAGSIANEKLSNSKVTIAGNDVSLGGSLAATTLTESLGLSKAMRFIGVATVAITDGSTTDPVISGYSTKTAGDVIIDKDSSREYVWSTTGKWELLGGDSSYKVTQSTVDSGATATNKWVSRIQQNANGVVTVTMETLDTSGTWSGNAATATNAANTQSNYGAKSFIVEGDADTYYPVIISGYTSHGAWTLLNISRDYAEQAPDTWNTSTHKGGLVLTILSNGNSAWGGNHNIGINKLNTIIDLSQEYSTMIADMRMTNFGLVIWLRGGSARYWITSNGGQSVIATPKYEEYTANSDTIAPCTDINTARLNDFRWNNLWTVKNATNAITATNLANNPSIQVSTSDANRITITAGEKTSDAFTVPYATTSTNAKYLYPFSDGTNVPGTSNISILQTIQNSDDTPRSVPFGVRLLHGNTEVGFGYFYPKPALYGGWYIASYGGPSYVAVTNGTWETYKILTSNNTTAGTNNAATLTWSTTYTIAKINGTDIKFTTMAKPSYAFTDLTAHPTTLSGYGITDANIASGVITLGSNTITPVTNVNGHTGSSVDVTAADLGLSNALHFIGITSTTLADGSTTATLTAKSTNSLSKTTGFVDGDVVMDGDQLREYVWSGDAWRLLGITTSTAYTQPTSTATNTWIAQISQGTDGRITATTGSLDTSGTWSGTATTATNLSAKPSLAASGNNITVTAGGKTSDAFTVPYATSATSAATSKALANYYTSRPENANITHVNNGGIIHFKATSTMTSNKPMGDGSILHFYWDNENAWNSQLYMPDFSGNSMQWRSSSAAGTWDSWRTLLDSNNYTDYAYALDGSNTGTKLQISTQSAAYTNGIQFMYNTTKKGSIGTDNSGIIGIYGTKIVLRPQLDAATKGVEITTDAIYPTASMTLGSTSAKWSKLYIGNANNHGDAYTPVYWNDGVPTAVTPIQYCEFTIGSGKKGVKLTHAAFTAASYVVQIVVTSGESNLNSTIAWESAAGYINLTCSATSGAVSGYILVSRGGAITATATDIT